MNDSNIIISFISGLFALLGGFLGAWLARKTEYKKWLRQQRGVEFTEFIKKLEVVRQKAREILYVNQLSDKEIDTQITELFIGLKSQENIVRLYLEKIDREMFSDLKHELWSYYSPDIKQTVRMKKHKELLQDIQTLFEKNIKG